MPTLLPNPFIYPHEPVLLRAYKLDSFTAFPFPADTSNLLSLFASDVIDVNSVPNYILRDKIYLSLSNIFSPQAAPDLLSPINFITFESKT